MSKLQTEGKKRSFSNYGGENNKMKISAVRPIKWVVENQKSCAVHEHKVKERIKIENESS